MKAGYVGILVLTCCLMGLFVAYNIHNTTSEDPFANENSTIQESNLINNDIKTLDPAESPSFNAKIESTTVVFFGKVPGTWFFEGSFPVMILSSNNEVLASGFVSAQGDWMTANSIPFKGVVSLNTPYKGKATAVFSKDNPSGLSQYDASTTIPLIFE